MERVYFCYMYHTRLRIVYHMQMGPTKTKFIKWGIYTSSFDPTEEHTILSNSIQVQQDLAHLFDMVLVIHDTMFVSFQQPPEASWIHLGVLVRSNSKTLDRLMSKRRAYRMLFHIARDTFPREMDRCRILRIRCTSVG